MKYIVKKRKKTNECDGAATGNYDFGAALGFGMGPVNPNGGPDKFGPIICVPYTQASSTHKRKYKVRRRKNG